MELILGIADFKEIKLFNSLIEFAGVATNPAFIAKYGNPLPQKYMEEVANCPKDDQMLFFKQCQQITKEL